MIFAPVTHDITGFPVSIGDVVLHHFRDNTKGATGPSHRLAMSLIAKRTAKSYALARWDSEVDGIRVAYVPSLGDVYLVSPADCPHFGSLVEHCRMEYPPRWLAGLDEVLAEYINDMTDLRSASLAMALPMRVVYDIQQGNIIPSPNWRNEIALRLGVTPWLTSHTGEGT